MMTATTESKTIKSEKKKKKKTYLVVFIYIRASRAERVRRRQRRRLDRFRREWVGLAGLLLSSVPLLVLLLLYIYKETGGL